MSCFCNNISSQQQGKKPRQHLRVIQHHLWVRHRGRGVRGPAGKLRSFYPTCPDVFHRPPSSMFLLSPKLYLNPTHLVNFYSPSPLNPNQMHLGNNLEKPTQHFESICLNKEICIRRTVRLMFVSSRRQLHDNRDQHKVGTQEIPVS